MAEHLTVSESSRPRTRV